MAKTCMVCDSGMCMLCAIIAVIAGVLFLLQDLNVWNFWNISWYTVAFLLVGIMSLFGHKK